MKVTDGVVAKYVYGRDLIGEEVNNAFKTYHFDFIGGTISYGRQCRRFLGTDGSIECCDSINEYTKVLVSKDTNIDLSIIAENTVERSIERVLDYYG